MHARIYSLAATLGALALAACASGPKKGPANPARPPSATTTPANPAAVVPVPKARPRRKLSGEVKKDFAKLVGRYKEATKEGKRLSKEACGEIAGGFADIYAANKKLVEARFNEAVVWEECGEVSRAEGIYKEIVTRSPKFGPAQNNLGRLAYERGKVNLALGYFQRAAKAKNSEGYANLALIDRERALSDPAQVAEGVKNVHRALALDSFNVEAYALLATMIYDHAKSRAQLEMARLICVQAAKVDARFAPIFNVMGLVLLRMKKVTPALAQFKKAAGLDPNFTEAHMNIGSITLNFRDYETAKASYRKVLGLEPPKKVKVDATIGLGVAMRGLRHFKEAMDLYRQARSLDPGRSSVLYNMGILVQDYLFDASTPEKGIKQLEEAAGYLSAFVAAGKNARKIKDAKRRLKNIKELIPMMREQQKMMREMQRMQELQKKQEEEQRRQEKKQSKAAKPAPAAGGKK